MKLCVGDRVILKRDRTPWYSGYGMNPSHTLRAGDVGIVKSVNIPAVRAVPGRPLSYAMAWFGNWQVDLQPEDVRVIATGH